MNQIHVCLLSSQLLPNLIPILAERPTRVYLIVTPEMEHSQRDKRMNRILRKEGIDVRVRPRAPSTGLASIREYAAKLAKELISAEAGNLIVLNATGGTKLLAMGFVEVFRESLEGYPLRVIYTDTEHRTIETVVPRGQAPTPMRGVLNTESYLAAQGMILLSVASDDDNWRTTVRQRASVTEFLTENCAGLRDFFGMTNKLVHHKDTGALSQNGQKLVRPLQEFSRRPQGLWKTALSRLAQAKLFVWDGNKEIEIESLDAANYLGGRWIEEYAWLAASAAGLADARSSAKGRWESHSGPDAPTNEFDLLAVHDNRMLIVECKTGKPGASEQAITTRLDSLAHNAGGLFGASMLVSARELPPTMRKRCENLGIHVLEQDSISELSSRLEAWRDTGNIPDK